MLLFPNSVIKLTFIHNIIPYKFSINDSFSQSNYILSLNIFSDLIYSSTQGNIILQAELVD